MSDDAMTPDDVTELLGFNPDALPTANPAPPPVPSGPPAYLAQPVRRAPQSVPTENPRAALGLDIEVQQEYQPQTPLSVGADRPEIERLLVGLVTGGGSDMHITHGEQPRYRVSGSLLPISGEPVLASADIERMLKEIASPAQWETFTSTGDVDFSYAMNESSGAALTVRFRVNAYRSMDQSGAVFRVIPTKIVTLDQLGIPPQVKTLATKPRGLILFTGPTGSGKAVTLSTLIPTPTGYTAMGALTEGDEVLGSDGQPCRVTGLSPINETPELFRVKFSDGQEIIADLDHQWLVSSHEGRGLPTHRSLQRPQPAQTVREHAHRDADALDALADTWDAEQDALTVDDLHSLLLRVSLARHFPSPNSVYNALRMTDATFRTRPDSAVEYPSVEALHKLAERLRQRFWNEPVGQADLSRMTTGEMLASGVRLDNGSANFAVPVTSALELPARTLPVEPYLFGMWLANGDADGTIRLERCDVGSFLAHSAGLWGAPIMVRAENEGDYSVLSFERPNARACVHGTPHHESRDCTGCETPATNLPFGERVTGMVAVEDRHIPVEYLRASYQQRLAVLQGLMDMSGRIREGGSCELGVPTRRLAIDVLDLIRSLGIKATIHWDQPDGDNVVHRIQFVTDQPTARFARKAKHLPIQLRAGQRWIYVTDIEPVRPGDSDYGPARCITVDSADHSYLCGSGYVVTSNSTSMAGLVDLINETRAERIFTLEDPIEFTHSSKKSLISHREVGADTVSFEEGLKRVRRQDPDVILIGEMRDYETIGAAIEAADTGHLVIATLHTNSAPETISRIINSFPAERQDQIRVTLSSTLLAVISQTLVPSQTAPRGRVLAAEIMMVTPAIANNIRENDIPAIVNALTDRETGSISLDAHLAQLIHEQKITRRDAALKASSPEALDRQLGITER